MFQRAIENALLIESLAACTSEARGRGFLFICTGGDCEPWQYILLVLSVVLVIFFCCYGCAKAK